MHKILFIINPVSGSGAGLRTRSAFESVLEKHPGLQVTANFLFTESQGHAGQLARESIGAAHDLVVACGGDGTVNEVASALSGTGTTMSIFPIGSGNGLARHYQIPNQPETWLPAIITGKTIGHDAARINGHLAFNVSGIGFDAHVASLFGKDGKRGFNSYLRLIISEFRKYRSFKSVVTTDLESQPLDSFMMPIAVASQFGNSAFIAPDAETNDGLTDLQVVRKMPAFQVLPFAIRVFTKSIKGSSYATSFRSKTIQIACEHEQPLHIDGEPQGKHNHFNIESIKSAIQLRIPDHVK
jgi:YegS/Rv2252/BmrU family lipid kinase